MEMNGERLKWLVLLTVIVGTFLGRLDQTIVNLALPRMMDDFSITVSEAGWIATAYILANAVFVPIWGKLGDTIGRKKVYVLGFAIFIFGSVLAGLSWDLSSMIVFRIIQAIAGSADYPTAMAIIAVTFRNGRERAEALGIWSASFAAAAVFGPLLGGPLIDLFGWRSVFLINLPIGILGLAMALAFVRESVSEKPATKFDVWGALALGIALSSLVLVLDKGMEWGWLSSESFACYLATAFFGWLFTRIEARHPEPLLDLGFFSNPSFVGGLANNFVVFMGMLGSVFLIPIFVQTFLGYSATETGYLFMPMAAGLMIAAPLGAQLMGRVKANTVVAISTFGAGVGLYLFSLSLDPRSSALDVMIPVFVLAFSMGFGMAQRTNVIAAAVPDSQMGEASSVLALVRNIAGAFGIALFGTLYNESVKSNLLRVAAESTINTSDPSMLSKIASLMALKAQMLSYHEVFIAGAIVLFLGGVIALFLEVKDNGQRNEMHVE